MHASLAFAISGVWICACARIPHFLGAQNFTDQFMSLELLQMNVINFLDKLNVVVIQRLMVNSNLLRTQKLFARETEHKLVVSKDQFHS